MSECKINNESFEIKEKGKINRVLLNGYWIWWCYKHHQPLAWCEKHNIEQQRDDLLNLCKEFMEIADDGSAAFDDPAPGSIFLRAKAVIANCQT